MNRRKRVGNLYDPLLRLACGVYQLGGIGGMRWNLSRSGFGSGGGLAGGIGLMRPALGRMAAVLRGTTTIVGVVAALLGAGGPVTWGWLAPALGIVVSWTLVYVVVAWRHGLRSWLVAADLLAMATLGVALGHLVPVAAARGTVNWIGLVAGMAVVADQLGGLPAVSIPCAFLVAAGYVAGARLAHLSYGGALGEAQLFLAMAAVAAAAIAVALRAERAAVRAFAELGEARAVAAVVTARRDAERAQLRMVHNGPLTTLTMALHAGDRDRHLGAVLQARAAATLEALQDIRGGSNTGADSGARQVRLDERLANVASWYQMRLRIAAGLRPCLVPAEIAAAFAAGAAEALENAARHAGVADAAIDLANDDGLVTVTVTDRGRGFDVTRPARQGFGLREDLIGRMAAVGGTAVVRSVPGAGTAVCLQWLCR